ncbi:MAG: hypothetical protein NXI14_02000 [bacterium]|nr:hypothetical protein [bacterium]
MEPDSKLRAVLDAVSALKALAFNAERIAERVADYEARSQRMKAPAPPGTSSEKRAWTRGIADLDARGRIEVRERELSTVGDRTLKEAREWCERLSEAVVGFGRVDIAKAAPELTQAWMSFDHALRGSTPGIVLTLDAERIRRATDAARDAVETMNAEAVAKMTELDQMAGGLWVYFSKVARIAEQGLAVWQENAAVCAEASEKALKRVEWIAEHAKTKQRADLFEASENLRRAWTVVRLACTMTPSDPVAIVKQLEKPMEAMQGVQNRIRAGDAVAGGGASEPERKGKHPAKKLPELHPHAMEAWRLYQVSGYSQERVAEMLNSQYGTDYKQWKISRFLKQAREHTEASGSQAIVEKTLPNTPAKISTMDPHTLEMGRRVEATGYAQRAKERQNASDDE